VNVNRERTMEIVVVVVVVLVLLRTSQSIYHQFTNIGARVGVNVERMVQYTREDPMTACYIDSSFPSFLYYL